MPENLSSHGKADSPSFREIPAELRQILNAHQLWLKGEKGERAVLPHYSFQDLDLSGENLERADLSGAEFQGANLGDANLRQAQLRGANFSRAVLTGTDFRDADLERAVMGDSKDLAPLLLARANLAGCRLSEDQGKFVELDYVKEASGITSNIFTAMLIVCVYAGITVFTTSDVGLLTNTGTTTLPLLGVGISVASFYFAAPLLLLAIYVYFHFNLQHLWDSLANLPAVFPDGQRLDQKVYPWLFNWLPCSYFLRIKEIKNRRVLMEWLQKYLVAFFAWYLLPFTLILLWGRYLWVRDKYFTYYHLLVIFAAIWAAFQFRYLAGITLQGKNGQKGRRFILNTVMAGVVFLLLSTVTDGFINGVPIEWEYAPKMNWYDQRWLVPKALDYLRLKIVVNFEEREVSNMISKGDEQKGDKGIAKENQLAMGAPLKERDLRCVEAKGAFLARADLRRAYLEGANLVRADLWEAKLGEADEPRSAAFLARSILSGSNLSKACLYKANLERANLEAAILAKCNLEAAILSGANLRNANLKDAMLKKAVIRDANLQGADLTGVKDLTALQVREARAWILAKYDSKLFKDLGFPEDHNNQVEKRIITGRNMKRMNFRETDLSSYDFTGASLQEANLEEANLYKTNLQRADLTRAKLRKCRSLRFANFQEAELWEAALDGANLLLADFRGTKGLNKEQLKSAKNWSLAFYDAGMIQLLSLPKDHNARFVTQNLRGYDLRGAYLRNENLAKADLQEADLSEADLQRAYLEKANLQGAKLTKAKVKEAVFKGANLAGADLTGADLTGAYLAEANLQGAKLTKAKVDGSVFQKANLAGADLTGVRGLSRGQLQGAKTDQQTKLP